MIDHKIQFVSIATNDYLSRWKSQVAEIRQEILDLDWQWVLLTDNVDSASEFVQSAGLRSQISIHPILPVGFPLASMVRYLAILEHCGANGWICYIDADMRIENAEILDATIKGSNVVHVVSHPGYTRASRVTSALGFRRNLANLILEVVKGGLGDWETRKKSDAHVPRRSRKTYVQAAIFFGPSGDMHRLSRICWDWTERDLRKGIVPRWHDESYLNRWSTLHPHSLLGPEYCYFDFPWLSPRGIVVRAVDKNIEPAVN